MLVAVLTHTLPLRLVPLGAVVEERVVEGLQVGGVTKGLLKDALRDNQRLRSRVQVLEDSLSKLVA